MTAPAPVSHAPDDYVCPFCGLVASDVSDPGNRCELGDTVYQDEDLLVLIAVDGFGEHEGHAMVARPSTTRTSTTCPRACCSASP